MTPRQLALGGFAGMPLAMLALPVYLHTPALYAREFGLSLGLLGGLLFAVRLLDTVLDPLLGYWQDSLSPIPLRNASLLATVSALAGFTWLVSPQPGWPIWPQLIASLLLVYLAHGWLGIALLRYGALLWPTTQGRVRVTAWREGWGVLGILLASALAAWWARSAGEQAALQQFVWLLLPCALLAWWALRASPAIMPAAAVAGRGVVARAGGGKGWAGLALVLLMNGLAMAIPATLLHFYVADVLQAESSTALFLLAYFLAAMLALPLWVRLADRCGKAQAWCLGMLLAMAGFVPVFGLQSGALGGFLLVCVLTGIALGADLALAAAMVADKLGEQAGEHGGKVFGVMSMLNKLALALAAGLALPLAEWSGYQPGQNSQELTSLYAGLPMFCKGVALLLLWRLMRKEYAACGANAW